MSSTNAETQEKVSDKPRAETVPLVLCPGASKRVTPPPREYADIMNFYKVGQLSEDGRGRELFGVIKQLDALLLNDEERKKWQTAVVNLHFDCSFLAPEINGLAWTKAAEIANDVFHPQHANRGAVIEIWNGQPPKT